MSDSARKVTIFILLILTLALAGLSVVIALRLQEEANPEDTFACWCTGSGQCPAGWGWGGGEDYCDPGLKCCSDPNAGGSTGGTDGGTTDGTTSCPWCAGADQCPDQGWQFSPNHPACSTGLGCCTQSTGGSNGGTTVCNAGANAGQIPEYCVVYQCSSDVNGDGQCTAADGATTQTFSAGACPTSVSCGQVDLYFGGGYCGYSVLNMGSCGGGSTDGGTTDGPTPFCGDGIKAANEQCDDGNQVNGDGCDVGCIIPSNQPVCGDGNVDPGEICDDGNTIDTDACKNNCTPPVAPKVCGETGCTIDSQCATGLVCDDGRCILTQCKDNASCTDNGCKLPATAIWDDSQDRLLLLGIVLLGLSLVVYRFNIIPHMTESLFNTKLRFILSPVSDEIDSEYKTYKRMNKLNRFKKQLKKDREGFEDKFE